jgi:hypothetical protein
MRALNPAIGIFNAKEAETWKPSRNQKPYKPLLTVSA